MPQAPKLASIGFTPNTICSLFDLVQAGPSSPLVQDCRLAYVFVIGANPNGPTQLLEFNDTYPLALQPSQAKPYLSMNPSLENDIVYLNIAENGKFGKSPTWFKHGLTMMQQHSFLQFDYIIKTDRHEPY